MFLKRFDEIRRIGDTGNFTICILTARQLAGREPIRAAVTFYLYPRSYCDIHPYTKEKKKESIHSIYTYGFSFISICIWG